MRIGITGATGMIGQALGQLAERENHEVVAYSRRTAKSGTGKQTWISTAEHPLPETKLDALVHLAGENLLGLWTKSKRESIWNSRVELTQKIVAQLKTWAPENRPRVLLSASGVGYYGDRGDSVLDESSSRGTGFLADLCEQWEAAASEAASLGIRIVHLRTGVVLSRGGGAFPLMRRAFACGVGGRFGSGKQWMSWIHEQDQVGLILWAIQNESVTGPLNLCAPGVVTNADFTRQLAAKLRRPAFMHVPALALRLLMPGMGQEMLLASQRAVPNSALRSGYSFAHPTLESALAALI
jgi:uncharacterized protein (TIGR01777 family)